MWGGGGGTGKKKCVFKGETKYYRGVGRYIKKEIFSKVGNTEDQKFLYHENYSFEGKKF